MNYYLRDGMAQYDPFFVDVRDRLAVLFWFLQVLDTDEGEKELAAFKAEHVEEANCIDEAWAFFEEKVSNRVSYMPHVLEKV